MQTFKQGISKKDFVKELKNHQKLDAFIKGKYDSGDGKGCAVGCSLMSVAKINNEHFAKDNHSLYEKYLGIPEWLARVEDTIFEGVSLKRSKTWPVEFAQAIPIGVDLESIKSKLMIVVMKRNLKNFDHDKYPQVKSAIDNVIKLWKRKDIGSQDWQETAYAADAARYAAYAAAGNAADVARYAAYAADVDRYAADAELSKTKTFEYFADELIKLLKKCK